MCKSFSAQRSLHASPSALGGARAVRSPRGARQVAAATGQAAAPPTTMPSYKLYYFPLPGRGEVARLCCAVGGLELEEVRFPFDQWPKYKAIAPFGQCPFLEVDGTFLAQSAAIDRYLAAEAGLVPKDAFQAALADQAYNLCIDILTPLFDTFKVKDEAERIKAREAVVAGPLKEKLGYAETLVAKAGDGFVAGPELTYGDLHLFHALSTIISGWMDGVPKTALDGFPALQAHRNRVASVPQVKAFYEREDNQDDMRQAYKPNA
ncbi:hypothetical protein MNEG_8880 [Monoraphidium neglectum]|uniref:Glutathione S-transferase n=1 Tax=Monoraphidium neglectum TaxID=145388 RepID=A0A0D2KUK2_9CHLO|nr:hypothetical protein MNEG_8880 [Monoraphidium neglectum]KIY99083.1 hypothetical protein MNEG_8880 [Monoraphidium neglectum]|eukprot:XP_013898103.1 hypothetical protein MNEG_8880 [Monoraphidium neglectum]